MSGQIQDVLALGMPQGLDWVWIFLILLLLFGGRKLPDIARSIGKSLNELKKGIKEAKDTKDEIESDVREIKDDVVNETKKASGLCESDNGD